MSPVTPEMAEALIPRESDTFCVALKNNLKMLVLAWKMVRFMFNINGTISSDFRQMICEAGSDCPDTEGDQTDV
jgi:hypothetical protein